MTLDGPFLLDVMCGKLAVYLRICGYDALYALDRDIEADDAIRALAQEEERTVVTRDRQLAASSDGVLLTERGVEGQLRELRDHGLALTLDDEPSFCGACNGPVVSAGPEEPAPDYVPDDESDLWRCRDCGQYCWFRAMTVRITIGESGVTP